MGTPFKMKGNPMQRNFGIGSPVKHWGHYPGGDYDHSIADHAKERVEEVKTNTGKAIDYVKEKTEEAKTYVKEKTEEAKEDPVGAVSDIYIDVAKEYVKPYKSAYDWLKKKFD